MDTLEKLAEMREEAIGAYAMHYDAVLAKCESPIEQLFLACMVYLGWEFSVDRTQWESFLSQLRTRGLSAGKIPSILIHPDAGWMCAIQPTFDIRGRKTRFDFAFLSYGGWFAVELDGHEFHEKTKSQAQRDKSRDRRSAAEGWITLRFTGSEVFADPDACLSELHEQFGAHFDRATGRR